MTWKKGVDEVNSNPSSFTIARFTKRSLKNEVEVSIEGEKRVFKFTIKLLKEYKLSNKNEGFDENNNHGYSTYLKKKPFKFIEKGKNVSVKANTKPSNNSLKNHIKFFTKPLNSIEFNNYQYSNKYLIKDAKGKIENTPIGVNSCNELSYYGYVGSKKEINLEIYWLIESDDDEANFCIDESISENERRKLKKNCLEAITSEDHVCWEVGPDGTFDLHRTNRPRNFNTNDGVALVNTAFGSMIAPTASANLSCDTDPKRNNTGRKSNYSQSKILTVIGNVNAFFNEYGVYINPVVKGDLLHNYDTREDDSKLSDKEMRIFHEEFNPSRKPILLLTSHSFKDDPNVKGKGMYLNEDPFKTCFVTPGNNDDLLSIIIAHELGHSLFACKHSEDLSPPVNDTDNLMKAEYNNSSRLNELFFRAHYWSNLSFY